MPWSAKSTAMAANDWVCDRVRLRVRDRDMSGLQSRLVSEGYTGPTTETHKGSECQFILE